MKRRILSAVAVAAAVAVIAGCGSGSSGSSDKTTSASKGLDGDGKGKTITVWLQSDAQKGWPAVVAQATSRFQAATGATVKVEWQNWSNYTTKLDSTFAGSSGVPDVVELGNTQTASYIAGGAFADLSADKADFANSGTWLQGLAESVSSPDGKLYGVPYYAGSRLVIYRKDLWSKAGVTTPPTTLDEVYTDLDKVKAANSADKNFSSFYMPGKYWSAAIPADRVGRRGRWASGSGRRGQPGR
ncbi:MAG: extracellular solute-binding protein [bacterium]